MHFIVFLIYKFIERADTMNLSQLHYFQIVAEEEHISRAAEKLHISQPSLSTTIHRLEAELDTPLFDHRGRNIYLNEAGQKLLKHVNYIFDQIDLLEKDLNAQNFYMAHGLSMAVNNSSFLEGWLSEFITSHDNARITQYTMTEKSMLSALESEIVDLAIGDFSNIPPDITARILIEDEYMVAVPPSHPLSEKKSLFFNDICKEPFSSLPSSSVNCFINIMFAQKNTSPNVIFEGQLSMMFNLLIKGHALMFSSRESWNMYLRHAKEQDHQLYTQLLNVPLLPVVDLHTSFNLSVCWKKDRKLPIMAKKLLDVMTEQYQKAAKEHAYSEGGV